MTPEQMQQRIRKLEEDLAYAKKLVDDLDAMIDISIETTPTCCPVTGLEYYDALPDSEMGETVVAVYGGPDLSYTIPTYIPQTGHFVRRCNDHQKSSWVEGWETVDVKGPVR